MMNHFQRRSRGMSSQLAAYTTRKKIANVIVGKSTLPPVGHRCAAAPAAPPVAGMLHQGGAGGEALPAAPGGPESGRAGRRRHGAGEAVADAFGEGAPASPCGANHSSLIAAITASATSRPPA